MDVVPDPVGDAPLLKPVAEGVGDDPPIILSPPSQIRGHEELFRAKAEVVTSTSDGIATLLPTKPTILQDYLLTVHDSPETESRLLPYSP